MFDISSDPKELENIITDRPQEAQVLQQTINELTGAAEAQQLEMASGHTVDIGDDERLLSRLRGLGYLE